jgi:hypothetical protein
LSPDNVPKDGLRAKTRNAPLSEELVKEAKPSEAIEIPITLVKHGSAPYLNDKANSASYYAELSNGQVKWGIGLKDAIETSGAKIGDTVDVSQTGNKDVIVPVQIKDDQGVVVSTEQRDVKRNEWLVTVNEPQKLDKKTNRESVTELNKDKSYLMLGQGTKNTQKVKDPLKVDNNIFDVKYQWSAEDNKTIVTINGSKPSDIAPEKLAKIAAKDPFLKKFGVAAVASGKLDLSLSKGVQPIPAKYNGEGQAVAVKPDTVQGPKLK